MAGKATSQNMDDKRVIAYDFNSRQKVGEYPSTVIAARNLFIRNHPSIWNYLYVEGLGLRAKKCVKSHETGKKYHFESIGNTEQKENKWSDEKVVTIFPFVPESERHVLPPIGREIAGFKKYPSMGENYRCVDCDVYYPITEEHKCKIKK